MRIVDEQQSEHWRITRFVRFKERYQQSQLIDMCAIHMSFNHLDNVCSSLLRAITM